MRDGVIALVRRLEVDAGTMRHRCVKSLMLPAAAQCLYEYPDGNSAAA